jgi:hypothetical protein
MPRKVAHPNPRSPDQIDLDRLRTLREDPELWTTERVRSELGPISRHAIRRLWVRTRAYLEGAQTSWPPGAAEVGGQPLAWWPPHHAALPPPDVLGSQPRWRAGNIRTWAMSTGRMDVDGTPNPSPTSGGVTEKPVETRSPLDPALVEQARALRDASEMWTIHEISRELGVGLILVDRWQRRTRNRLERGVRLWPPPDAEVTVIHGLSQPLTWWPPHPRLLPPPDAEQDSPTGGWVWRKGVVAGWALQTGRCHVVDGALALGGADGEGEAA